MAAVLQWAHDEGRFSSAIGDHNGINPSQAKHGGQMLIYFDTAECRISYDGAGSFSIDTGYGNRPSVGVTWYGMIMFCNWLTEMRDENTENLVYTGIDTDWESPETSEDRSKNGYRLPTHGEWEYTARYRGSDSTNTVAGYSDPYFTRGDSASGATADYTDAPACQAVAVYGGSGAGYSEPEPVTSLGASSGNALGIYDMSGNVNEWCFSNAGGDYWTYCGGGWGDSALVLRIGFSDSIDAPTYGDYLSFRLCRSF